MDPNVAELPKIKVLESSSSFNYKSLPDNNEIMRHYIQKIKLEDSTNETYIERHIEVKFIGN